MKQKARALSLNEDRGERRRLAIEIDRWEEREGESLRNNEGNSTPRASSSIVKMAARGFFWRIDAPRDPSLSAASLV